MDEPRKRYIPKRDKRDTATRLADYVSSLKLNNPKLTPREIANLLEISPFHPPEAVRWSANVVTKLLSDRADTQSVIGGSRGIEAISAKIRMGSVIQRRS